MINFDIPELPITPLPMEKLPFKIPLHSGCIVPQVPKITGIKMDRKRRFLYLPKMR